MLGASGSIGKQTIDILKGQDDIKLVAVSVYRHTDILDDLLKNHGIRYAYAKETAALADRYPDVRFYDGDEGILQMMDDVEYDLLINALVGYAGFKPTYKAVSEGKDVALANKESLVVGGDLIKKAMRESGARLYPIDSEHSAIHQALKGSGHDEIKRLIITASGGAFRDKRRCELVKVTKEDALTHPTWQMGAKITIDSATMMNKGFEVIEAHHLFDVDFDKIDVVIHKESIVHSLVEFNDGSVLAQLSEPDMRLPISYALFDRHRAFEGSKTLDLLKGPMTFYELDDHRFPLVSIAKAVAKLGGNLPAYLNGANDTAVSLFLNGKIGFLSIEELIIKVIKEAEYHREQSVDGIDRAYHHACELVYSYIDEDIG